MDIDQLRLHLKEEYTYEGTTKEIFLNEVASIFEENKDSGDTELLMYPGICRGNCESCDGCGREGYRFVGNTSKDYIDLVFKLEGDDIKDIFSCTNFETTEEIIDLNNPAFICIDQDDKVTFDKSPEYWSKVNAATAAYSEICTTPTRRVDFEELCYWVDKHALLYERIGNYDMFKPDMKWTPFSMVYASLSAIRTYIPEQLHTIEVAINEFENVTNEEQSIQWVLQFETLYKTAPADLKCQFKKEGDYYLFKKRSPIYFYGQEFTTALVFLNSYQEIEAPLLSKYNTCTQDEEKEAYSNIDAFLAINSLKFHLQKRKAMEEIGITIPLYVRKTNDPPL